MNYVIKRFARATVLMGGLFLVASCSTPKDVTYFQDVKETVLPVVAGDGLIKIEPGDRVSVIVKSKDPALADLYNLTVNTNRLGTAVSSPEGMSSYIVSKDGTIDFPVLGTLKVAGMTRSELAGFITGELRAGHVRDAVVSVELMNASFSAMGEVKQPGRIPITKDRITILEALSL
ncbi:MAG: polysaccharide biosynthesis/export family protein, partial [Muribaculaceae bacterium]|nr:polysaccharide biosynthesis/export family protein [Muribaculaceae bacterium]